MLLLKPGHLKNATSPTLNTNSHVNIYVYVHSYVPILHSAYPAVGQMAPICSSHPEFEYPHDPSPEEPPRIRLCIALAPCTSVKRVFFFNDSRPVPEA